MKNPDQKIRPCVLLGLSVVALAIVIAGYHFRGDSRSPASAQTSPFEVVVSTSTAEHVGEDIPQTVSVVIGYEQDTTAPIQIRNTNEFRIAGQ